MTGGCDRVNRRMTAATRSLFSYLPVDTSRPVDQVTELGSLVFGLKEKEQFSGKREK